LRAAIRCPAISDYLRAANRCPAIADYLRCGQLPGHSQYCAAAICCYSRPLGHSPQLRLPFVVLFAPPRPFAAVAPAIRRAIRAPSAIRADGRSSHIHHTDGRPSKFISPTSAQQSSLRHHAIINMHHADGHQVQAIQPIPFNAYDKRSYEPFSQSHSMPLTKGRRNHPANPIQCL